MIYIIVFITIIGFSHEQPPDSPVGIIAQSKNNSNEVIRTVDETENANSSNIGSVGSLGKYHNATDPSYMFIVQLELKTSRVEEPFAELEARLNKLVDMAFVLAGYKHRKQIPPAEIPTDNSVYNTKIIKKRVSGDTTLIHFVTYAGSELILGEVVADDLVLLSYSQISAVLRHPLGKIISDRDIEAESSTKWWILLAIIFTGLILIAFGWFCLFCFFNVCGCMFGTEQGDYMTKAQRTRMEKSLDKKPLPMNIEEAAEQPNDALPSDGTNPPAAAKKVKLNKKTQRSQHTPSEIHFERRLQNERESIRKAIEEAFYKADEERKKTGSGPFSSSFGAVDTENTDVETAQRVSKSEKKRRHTKIGPITAVTTTTTTTNEQEGKTSEISGVSSVTTTSTDELDEFDVSNLPETTLKISKKKKKGEDEPEVKSEPESDYGSSLEDEKSKDEEEIAKEIHEENLRARPMTAKTHRTSLFGGTGISVIPAQPRAWTVYQAGDKVAEFWNNSRINNHPTPSSPTENGIVEFQSKNYFKF